jgi:RimJ/RimL family protein N-acetyltransferase
MNSTTTITLEAVQAPALAKGLWHLMTSGLDPIDAYFGPEGHLPRPRLGEQFYEARHEGELVGAAYLKHEGSTTVTFGLGLFPEFRGKGLSPALRDAVLDVCFAKPRVKKVETAIYSSNGPSWEGLHVRNGRMTEEGRQRATILVDGRWVDRILLGIIREEWEATR